MTNTEVTTRKASFPPASAPDHPAEFAISIVSLNPVRAWAAVTAIVARSGRRGPQLTEDEVIDTCADRCGMTATAEVIRQAR